VTTTAKGGLKNSIGVKGAEGGGMKFRAWPSILKAEKLMKR